MGFFGNRKATMQGRTLMARQPAFPVPTPGAMSPGLQAAAPNTDHWYLRQDGYVARPEIPASQQIGNYAAPLATTIPKNTPGVLRHDGVEGLSSNWNVPVSVTLWSAPMRGNINVLTAGRAETPISSYNATVMQAQGVTPTANRPAWMQALSQFLSNQGSRSS